MSTEVLIAGAGQLGSRYLQGMAHYPEPLSIWVLDPMQASLTRAKQRWEEVSHMGTAHEVHYVGRVATLPDVFDLAVVSTTADIRPGLAGEIARHSRVRNWVYEKVLAQDAQGLHALAACVENGHAWVNTPMYMWPLYKQLRSRFGNGPLTASFEGFRGLACNAIHYVDFVSRWNNASITQVDTRDLQEQWHPAKRERFYEIEGRLRIEFSDGSLLLLASGGGGAEYRVALRGEGQEWQAFEAQGYAISATGSRIEGGTAFQSALTAPLMADIFQQGACELPTLTQSIQQHEPFLSALLAHWHASGRAGNLLPIT